MWRASLLGLSTTGTCSPVCSCASSTTPSLAIRRRIFLLLSQTITRPDSPRRHGCYVSRPTRATPTRSATLRRATGTAPGSTRTTERQRGFSDSLPTKVTPTRSTTSGCATRPALGSTTTTPRRHGCSVSLPTRAAPTRSTTLGCAMSTAMGLTRTTLRQRGCTAWLPTRGWRLHRRASPDSDSNVCTFEPHLSMSPSPWQPVAVRLAQLPTSMPFLIATLPENSLDSYGHTTNQFTLQWQHCMGRALLIGCDNRLGLLGNRSGAVMLRKPDGDDDCFKRRVTLTLDRSCVSYHRYNDMKIPGHPCSAHAPGERPLDDQ
eukprot:m.352366 g.352366  ORF g.352366 m.352366 type:complete len:319 (-) comp27987_c0_seq34:1123-2079(-)